MPLAAGRTVNGQFVADRLVWFLPYVFVDNPYGAATGREVYGFAKMASRIALGNLDRDRHPVTVETLVYDRFAPNARMVEERLIVVERVSAVDGKADVAPGLASELSPFAQLLTLARATEFSLPLIEKLLTNLGRGRAPMVFLQQFRDSQFHSHAAYQAIVEASAVTTKFHGGGRLRGDFSVQVRATASHPIIGDLGLAGPVTPVLAAAWMHFDFVMAAGEVLWNRGRAAQG